jgi:glycosyltransferase involved in cell wall biosynthesis
VVMVNSRFTGADVAETLGIPEEKIHVAHPGVDDGFTPTGERAELGRPYALTVATLEPRKNLATLLEAYRRLDGSELALAVAGAAGWGDQPSLDTPGVLRLGYTPHDKLPDLYRGAGVFVYPSLFEGFGMPVVEAMACGVPCVSYDCSPGIREIITDGHDGIVVPPGSVAELSAGIRRLIEDTETRRSMGQAGIESAKRFSADHVLGLWDDLLATVER